VVRLYLIVRVEKVAEVAPFHPSLVLEQEEFVCPLEMVWPVGFLKGLVARASSYVKKAFSVLHQSMY
jgi:hypothetical protein